VSFKHVRITYCFNSTGELLALIKKKKKSASHMFKGHMSISYVSCMKFPINRFVGNFYPSNPNFNNKKNFIPAHLLAKKKKKKISEKHTYPLKQQFQYQFFSKLSIVHFNVPVNY
jgi:hypothetical protein